MIRFAAVLLAGLAMDAAVPELFERVRDKVVDNTSRVPRYTCVQTINRAQYRPQYGRKFAGCGGYIAAREELLSPGYLLWRDRLRLDVAVLNGRETFAWAGAREFETTDIEQLAASGSSGSGDFALFLSSVFGTETTRISLLREEKETAVFGFDVPLNASRYVYRSHGTGAQRGIGYHGTFLVDERLSDLKRLTVEADHFPVDENMCRVENVMDYHRVKIGDGDFLLPETAKMTVLFNDGEEAQNETHYSNCREYGAESSISFGDDDAGTRDDSRVRLSPIKTQLPSNLRLQIGLKSPIRSETAAAGDEVTGVILHDVKDVARANDIVHGRILRLEQFMFPLPRWVVALRFTRIEHNGVELPLDLKPTKGDGVFTFQQIGNLVLDQKFHSEWETR